MKKIFFLFVIYFSVSLTQSQTLVIFKTYEDFLNNKGETYTGLTYKGATTGPGFRVLVFKGNNGKIKLSQRGNWGFMFKGELYKFDNRRDPMWVGIVGKNICYYENGYGHLNGTGFCPAGWFYYISTDLNSDPFVIPTRRHVYKRVMDKNPATIPLFKCLDQKDTNYRKCVEEFEGIKCGSQYRSHDLL